MKKPTVKAKHVRELDLLPVMNLFMILTCAMMASATFEKLGILELWLPERSDRPEEKVDLDEGLLNLTLIITDNGISIGASGGFQPVMYYQEEVQYLSRSDQHMFKKVWVKGEEVRSPTDGKVMGPSERETIFLNSIVKKDSLDPGTFEYVSYNHEENPMLDTAGNWYREVPPVGSLYRVVGDESFRKFDEVTRRFSKTGKLSVYAETAKLLEKMHKMYTDAETVPPDVDDIVILAGENVIYDKIIQMMDACKAAGYDRVSLSLVGGEV